MTTPSPASISQRLTSTSSLLLERSRVLSLNLKPSSSSQTQITRNLTLIKNELDQLSLQSKGLVVGKGGKGKAHQGSGGAGAGTIEVEQLEERYDRLLDMFAEDQVGRDKVRELRREQKSPALPSPTRSPAVQTPPLADLPRVSIEPPTPGIVERFRDFPDDHQDDEDDHDHKYKYDPDSTNPDADEEGMTPHDMLSNQQELMDDQDARLSLLSHSIGRQNHLSIQIGSELDLHHQLLEDTDAAMDRTSASLSRARRRLDRVAHDAKQYGSTITIVGLIFILLILIIVFKT